MKSKEEKRQKIIAIVLVLAVIGLFTYKLFFENNSEVIDTETISIVTNQNDFFTVSSCANKFINKITADDKDSLLKMLSEEYKKDRMITKDNIYSLIKKIEGNYSLNPRKMFVQRVSEYKYKFYVYGYLQRETMNGIEGKEPYYLIVILNRKNMTFSIEGYDGDLFK